MSSTTPKSVEEGANKFTVTKVYKMYHEKQRGFADFDWFDQGKKKKNRSKSRHLAVWALKQTTGDIQKNMSIGYNMWTNIPCLRSTTSVVLLHVWSLKRVRFSHVMPQVDMMNIDSRNIVIAIYIYMCVMLYTYYGSGQLVLSALHMQLHPTVCIQLNPNDKSSHRSRSVSW